MSEAALHGSRDARGVVTLTLNRPASFNALSEEMIAALQSALDRLATTRACGWWCWPRRARPSAPGTT
jgi:enoyl-CoA hydratase/carnithine racemase